MEQNIQATTSLEENPESTFQIDTAMIFAAGHGKRMRPYTDHTPKPLLKVGGKSLIEYHLLKLREAGILRVVINLHWLGEQIAAKLGDGSNYGVEIHYSREPVLLETAGGMAKALPLLTENGNHPFLVINGDVWSDLDLRDVCKQAQARMEEDDLALLVMVENPAHHQKGDFILKNNRLTMEGFAEKLTYAGVGVYRPQIVADLKVEPMKLGPILHNAISSQKLAGWHFKGKWSDVGTPERLAQLEEELGK